MKRVATSDAPPHAIFSSMLVEGNIQKHIVQSTQSIREQFQMLVKLRGVSSEFAQSTVSNIIGTFFTTIEYDFAGNLPKRHVLTVSPQSSAYKDIVTSTCVAMIREQSIPIVFDPSANADMAATYARDMKDVFLAFSSTGVTIPCLCISPSPSWEMSPLLEVYHDQNVRMQGICFQLGYLSDAVTSHAALIQSVLTTNELHDVLSRIEIWGPSDATRVFHSDGEDVGILDAIRGCRRVTHLLVRNVNLESHTPAQFTHMHSVHTVDIDVYSYDATFLHAFPNVRSCTITIRNVGFIDIDDDTYQQMIDVRENRFLERLTVRLVSAELQTLHMALAPSLKYLKVKGELDNVLLSPEVPLQRSNITHMQLSGRMHDAALRTMFQLLFHTDEPRLGLVLKGPVAESALSLLSTRSDLHKVYTLHVCKNEYIEHMEAMTLARFTQLSTLQFSRCSRLVSVKMSVSHDGDASRRPLSRVQVTECPKFEGFFTGWTYSPSNASLTFVPPVAPVA